MHGAGAAEVWQRLFKINLQNTQFSIQRKIPLTVYCCVEAGLTVFMELY